MQGAKGERELWWLAFIVGLGLLIAALGARYQNNIAPAMRNAETRWYAQHIAHYEITLRFEWYHDGNCRYSVEVLDEHIVRVHEEEQTASRCGGEALTVTQLFNHMESVMFELPCFPGTHCCLTPLRSAEYDAEYSYPRRIDFEGGLNSGDIGAQCPLDAVPPLVIVVEALRVLG